jgi:acyl carrier protein phosphodiesterase
MNYLAHAHLSFNQSQILVGNMINDFVKGKKQFDYSDDIRKGILLHRAIDNFTDTHEATQQIKSFFKPQYRLYAGAFTDVAYDHFLANDITEFLTDEDLKQFTATVYKTLDANFIHLPQKFQVMLPNMIKHNWLYNYKSEWGIQKSFEGLVKRSNYLTESDIAIKLLNKHYEAMNSYYKTFYPDLKKFAAHQLQQLING